ncbi:MAG TPA: hypothetical protein VE978_11425 [Chitinophagales bacterium]|nr:hypothetical protein [Chitinophagales bacterium]
MKSVFKFIRNYFKKDCCRILLLIFSLSFTTQILVAQDMPGMNMQKDTTKKSMSMQIPMDSMNMEMTSSFSPNLSMNRDGSGTSWQPDANPMMMYMKMKGKNMYMFHGFLFLRYTSQDITNESDRGGDHFDAPSMFMFMWSHQFNQKNLFSFISMISFDPFLVGEAGYPLLFQTGESYKGAPLVDKQHPHDLIAELSVNYTHSFSKDIDLNAYFGYPGEPAVGPVVFMHRLSAMNNPDAPLGHHWQDATHITFGVGTLGFRYKVVKVEGSIFTGREPDENRYDFDKPRFDSYSYRVNLNPNKNFALQFSQGFIKSPEDLFPNEDVTRTTASIIHTKLLKHGKFVSSSLVWGMNHSSEGGNNLQSVLFESNLKLAPATIYGRFEFVQKDLNELQLPVIDPLLAPSKIDINALTIGLSRSLFIHFNTELSLGVQGTIDFPAPYLQTLYGDHPLSAEIYLKIAPASGHHHH